MIHNLKSKPEYFQAVWNDSKTFEIRKNDRNFQVGDYIILQEWNEEALNKMYFQAIQPAEYTGGMITAKIAYKSNFKQEDGYVVLGLQIIEKRYLQQVDKNPPIKMILEDVTWVDKIWTTDRT